MYILSPQGDPARRFGHAARSDDDLGAPCPVRCPAPPPPKGQFSVPNRQGHRWFTPEYRQYPGNLWHLAQVVRTRMLADRGSDRRGLPSESQIRYGIEQHPCNAHLKGKMFLPRFSSDRCTGKGNYYGSIYIPFEFDGAAPPKPEPRPPKPGPRPPKPGPRPPKPGGKTGGPSITEACRGALVRTALKAAATYVRLAHRRLDRLSRLPESEQAARWSAGPEKTWFGAFKEARLINVRNRMAKILETLESPRLVITCKWNTTWLGSASPGIRRITLGGGWKDLAGDDVKKIQTFIHEAAHIRGAVLGGDNIERYYGVAPALKRAQRRPHIAIRTAENLGFYAVCRASTTAGCP